MRCPRADHRVLIVCRPGRDQVMTAADQFLTAWSLSQQASPLAGTSGDPWAQLGGSIRFLRQYRLAHSIASALGVQRSGGHAGTLCYLGLLLSPYALSASAYSHDVASESRVFPSPAALRSTLIRSALCRTYEHMFSNLI